MSNITIQLPDERMQQLQKLAQEANVLPEELLRARVEEWLNRPALEFLQAAQNHAFIDGNKRIGHAAMETFLALNGFELSASTDEQEQVVLQLAAGQTQRPDFA